MIISLRGTSGAGKSHLVHEVTGLYSKHREVFREGRKKPLYTIHGRNPSGRCLVTPGHYQIANGGIDTLDSLDEAYRIALWAHNSGHDVLMEGKNMSDGTKFINELCHGLDVRVVLIDTPPEECIASVRARGHNISEKSILRTRSKVCRDYVKFECHRVMGDRQQCLETVRRWLRM